MTSANCAILATAIHTCPNLKTLDISNNVIGAGGCVSLFAALCNLQVFESLHVTNCKLGLEDAKSLNHLLRTASILYKISIGDNVPFSNGSYTCWLSQDFAATVLPVILNGSKVTHLTIATGTCLPLSALLKSFSYLSNMKPIHVNCLNIKMLAHSCIGILA